MPVPSIEAGRIASPNGRPDRAQEAIDLVRDRIEALYAERGDAAKLWGSMVKQTLKRRQPSFNESFYGFASFNELLEEAQARGQLELEMDKRSGGYVIRSIAHPSQSELRQGTSSSKRCAEDGNGAFCCSSYGL
jgi:hypothetical protein